MANENIQAMQNLLAENERLKHIENQRKLARDVRPMIARSGFYNPENDPEYVFQPFPETIRFENGKEVIVNNQDEKDALLKTKREPAKIVEVDVPAMAAQSPASAPKRGRPKKVQSVELPPNLE